MNDDTKPAALCGWVKLHHRCGVLVTLPVGVGFDYVQASQDIDAALSVGWLPREVGLEAGEQAEEFLYVSRIEVDGKNGACSRIFLYVDNDAMVYKSLDKYLNTDQDVADFETATGLKLDAVPLFSGEAAPKREGRTAQYCVKAPKSFRAIWKANPKYKDAPKGEDTRTFAEKRKRDFVRWDGQKPTQNETLQESLERGLISPGQVAQLDDLFRELQNLGGQVTFEALCKWLNIQVLEDLDQNGFIRCRAYLDDKITKRKAVAQ